MMEVTQPEPLTGFAWLNLFRVGWKRLEDGRANAGGDWFFASRKQKPTTPHDGRADAVVIIAFHVGPLGRRLVLTREYRIPLGDYEMGCPAGLVDEGEDEIVAARRELKQETGLNLTKVLRVSPVVYSSPGMTDEAVQFVFCECDGEPCTDGCEDTEDIEVILCDHDGVRSLMDSQDKIGAKLWPVLLMLNLGGMGII